MDKRAQRAALLEGAFIVGMALLSGIALLAQVLRPSLKANAKHESARKHHE